MYRLNNTPPINKEPPGAAEKETAHLTAEELTRFVRAIPRHDPYSGRPKSMRNNLWLARKRLGLPQKWVAALLGHRSASVISEYECGVKIPPLPIALKLQLIYQTPLDELFPVLQFLASKEVASARERRPYIAEREKLLNNPSASENE